MNLLTPIEKKVLECLSKGMTINQTATTLKKSKYTIDKYLRGIYHKYQEHNITAVVALAIRNKDIE